MTTVVHTLTYVNDDGRIMPWWLNFLEYYRDSDGTVSELLLPYGGRFESAATSFRDVDMIVFATESDMAWFLLEFG